MTALRKWRKSAAGDPNGTRTRVFAVKGDLPLESTARPAFHGLFRALYINGLQARGDAQGILSRRATTTGVAGTESSPVRRMRPKAVNEGR